MPSDVDSGYTPESEELELGIDVQFLRLRLWVVPGVYRHTSEAVAYLDLLPSQEPLPGQDVCLTTEALAGMALDLDNCTPHQETYEAAKKNKLGAGAARWRLRYSGITWENMPGAIFMVRAGLEDPPDPAWQAQTSIQVYQNLLALLNELSDDAALAPQINNPNRDDLLPGAMKPAGLSFRPGLNPEDIEANLREARENYKFAKAWMYILSGMTMPREYMYGPVYNIESWFGGGDQYICGGLRRKIINWLENRRFKRKDEAAANAIDRLEKMNGLDFGYYAIVPAHVWAGIFPAGADRFAEYRALDPWWTQAWPDEWRQPGEPDDPGGRRCTWGHL